MTEICDDKWLELGNKFCNLKTDFSKNFYYKVKEFKKKKSIFEI